MSTPVGYVMPPERMVLRVGAGEATGEGGRKYELNYTPGGLPLVRSRTTGKWFGLSWEEILAFAIAAGIDRADDKTEDRS